MQIAMSHVSRLDYKSTPGQLLEDCSLKERVVHARHPRNERGVTAIKRSFNVMTIIEDMTMSEEFAYYVYAVFDDIGTYIHPEQMLTVTTILHLFHLYSQRGTFVTATKLARISSSCF
jgi:hypothetical protein